MFICFVVFLSVFYLSPHLAPCLPPRDPLSQPVIHDVVGRASPKPASTLSRQETIAKNLKDEFNGEEHPPPEDAVVIKEELGRLTATRPSVGGGGGGGGGGIDGGVDDTFEDVDADVSGDGGGSWGEMALAGPSGMQPPTDANQPVSFFFLVSFLGSFVRSNIFSFCPQLFSMI